jgi:hypothetical protein
LQTELKELFGIDSLELSEGFTYLGYFLKSSTYTKKDWTWLIDKFEGKYTTGETDCSLWEVGMF